MDKYEFNIKVEQIKKLINKSDYETAMKIADTIEWRRVRNTNLLSMVATVYEKNEEYQEAKDILLLAFERAPIGKRLLYKLTELALKEGNTSEAEAYYREFCDLASDDPRQNLLRYLILKEKGAPTEQLIHSLEGYIGIELDEKWMYELAELYNYAGMKDDCIRMCDKIMLMFGLGQYVDKAMELKVQFAPLTQYQMDLVENRDKYEARLRAVEQEFNGPYRSPEADQDEEYEDEQDEIAHDFLEADLEANIKEAEVEERLAAEMSRISIEDYPDEDQLDKTRTFTDLKNLRTNTEQVRKAMPGMAQNAAARVIAEGAAAPDMVGAIVQGMAGAAGINGALAVAETGAAAAAYAGSLTKHGATPYSRGHSMSSRAAAESTVTTEPESYPNEELSATPARHRSTSCQQEYEPADYEQSSYDESGYDAAGYDQQGYSQTEDRQSGYNQTEYDQAEYSGDDYDRPDQQLDNFSEVPDGYYVMIEEISTDRGLELAVETLKYIHRKLGTKHQVAKITGEKLNNKGIFAVAEKIAGKDLIVEQAGALSDIVLEELDELISEDRTGINVILIDSPRRIEIICLHNPSLADKFERVGNIEEEPEVQLIQEPEEPIYEEPPAYKEEPVYEEDDYQEENEDSYDDYEEEPEPVRPAKKQTEPEPSYRAAEEKLYKQTDDDMSAEEFAQYACQYAGDIDCSISGKSMLALYERVEIMEEDRIPLTKESAEQLIEEAADKAEKPSFGKLLKGIVSPKYDKDGLLILKEEHFIN